MELNERAEMNEIPLLAIGRQSYDIASPRSEHQSGARPSSPIDYNGVGPSTMSDMWSADWRTYSCDLPHSYSLQAQHRAKRQHCWGTPLISEQQGVGPSFPSEDESMKTLPAELFGYCETANAGNPGYDFFQSTSESASTSRTHCPPHSLMLVKDSSEAIAANGTGHCNATASQGTGLASFFTESDWNRNQDSLLNESAESTKGKGVDQFDSTAGVGCIELTGCQEPAYFASALVSQREHENEKPGIPVDVMPKQRPQEVYVDFRSGYKRKHSPIDLVEAPAFEGRFTVTSESAASRVGGFGTNVGQNGFTNFQAISSASSATPWENPCSDSNPDYSANESHSSRCLFERSLGLFGSGDNVARSVTNHPLNLPSDLQSHSQSLFARNYRRPGHAHPFSRRNMESGSSNIATSTSLLQNTDHWPALGVDISPAPGLPVSNWGPSGSRRNNSAFSIPGSRDRGGSVFEGSHSRSMQGRALNWAMAAAAAAAPTPATPEQMLTYQLFSSGGGVVPTGREVDLPESSARTAQTATPFFNAGVHASYFPASGSDTLRVSSHPLQPASTAPSQEMPPGPSLEACGSVPGRPAGVSTLQSTSRGHRDALFSAPVQSILGMPFRGLHTLRADGEYRRQFLSEILNAMHHAFRSEDLNIEELVMLDPSIIYDDSRDQLREMRLDVDNMTYEELLALEERIGNVNTGLDEEKIFLCLRESKYSSLDATVAAISQDSDVKCSICQEDFVEEDKLGRLDCGHGYHSACIRQWLLLKNECPICKASAHVKS